MDLTRKQKRAIRLAISALKEVNQNKHNFGANCFIRFGAESQEKHYKAQQEILEAVKVLEELITERIYE